MRIVYLTDSYSEGMGYLQNCLPKTLAARGHEVHIISSEFQIYANGGEYAEVYEPYLGPAEQPLGSFSIDGYTLHRLRHKAFPGFTGLQGLAKLLGELKPEIVEVSSPGTGIAFQAAALAGRMNYKLFTTCHSTLYLVLPWLPKWRLRQWRRLGFYFSRKFVARLAHTRVEKCFAATTDCGVVAHRVYGVPESKILVFPLGSETDTFHPVRDHGDHDARSKLRTKHGFTDRDIVCLYTGRFTDQKKPALLAKAIEILRSRGEPYVALFIGNGKHGEEIRRSEGCSVLFFMKHVALADYYRAADIAVWPSHDSMSMLDAAACGIPVVASDKLAAVERYQGNGLAYREPDVDSLVETLLKLRQEAARRALGDCGAQKMRAQFSWIANAEARLVHYREACKSIR